MNLYKVLSFLVYFFHVANGNLDCEKIMPDEYRCKDGTYLQKFNENLVENVKIWCQQEDTDCLEFFPRINTKHLNRIDVEYCGLPLSSYKTILEKLNVSTVDSLQIIGINRREDSMHKEMGSYLFKGLSFLKNLRIGKTKKITILDNFLNEVPNLKKFELHESILTNIDRFNFSVLPQLESLLIYQTNLDRVLDGWFNNLTALKTLNLHLNKLKRVERSSFRGLEALTYIELSQNQIEYIDKEAFRMLPNLVQVSLAHNKLTLLEENLFQLNSRVTELELNGNLGLKLGDRFLSNLTNLEKIDISNCSLTLLPDHLFSESSKLTNICLEYNLLQTIPDSLFSGLSKLSELNLSKNQLTRLSEASFASLVSLKILNLYNNKLTRIDDNVFKALSQLTELDVHLNLIQNISQEAFDYLDKLKNVDLSYNQLYFVNYKRSLFSSSKFLQEINLSHNNLPAWIGTYMAPSEKLKRVDVSHNVITNLTLSVLMENASNSLMFDFSNNKITILNKDMFIGNKIRMKIDITNNPLNCDCYNYGLVSYLQDGLNKFLEILNYEQLKCASPQEYTHKKLTEIERSLLVCPMFDVYAIDGECDEKCGCFWKPEGHVFIMDCSNLNISSLPRFKVPIKIELNGSTFGSTIQAVEVYLSNNSLISGPSEGDGYEQVTKLDLSHNNISTVGWLPTNVSFIRMDHNQISHLSVDIIEQLNTTSVQNVTLDGNPWICDCSTSTFLKVLQKNIKKIDSDNIKCAENGLKIFDNEEIMCRSPKIVILSVSISVVLLLFLLATFIALYYKYELEIKVWFYYVFRSGEKLDTDKIYDAFICFSNKDDAFVLKKLLPWLETESKIPYKCCINDRDFIPGEAIGQQVAYSVYNSRRTLVVLTNNFIESWWSKFEFRTAHTQAIKEGRARVIVIKYGDVDESKLDDELNAYLTTNTYLKWGERWFWKKLMYALRHTNDSSLALTQKHANMMLEIDKEFEVVSEYPPQSTPPILSLNPKSLTSFPYDKNSQVIDTQPRHSNSLLIVNTIS